MSGSRDEGRKQPLIFFDLETSDRHFLGQILTFSFIEVGKNWQLTAELSGSISLSRLQLPAAEAILTNRINVLNHQSEAEDNEREAMERISQFLSDRIKTSSGKIVLVGYNSSRFDLQYLRTSMIRNGINPYLGGKVIYRDLLHLVKMLACRAADFPLPENGEDENRLSLSLENVASELGLLKGRQLHAARDDVLLTIALARNLDKRFRGNVGSWEPYEAGSVRKRGDILWQEYPQYDLAISERRVVTPMMLLDSDHRSSLWVDLKSYEAGEGEKSVRWINRSTGLFLVAEEQGVDDTLKKTAEAALLEFEGLGLVNYFQKSTCDIEQDIYRIDFDALEALRRAIWERSPEGVKKIRGRDARVIYLRQQMAEYEWGGLEDERMERMFKQYVDYRYGGKAQIGRFEETYHSTAVEMLERLRGLQQSGGGDDLRLLQALEQYYFQCDIGCRTGVFG